MPPRAAWSWDTPPTANHVLLQTEEGTERRGEPFQPRDAREDPRLPGPRLAAGGAAEAPACREQGAPQEPQQLPAATKVRSGPMSPISKARV